MPATEYHVWVNLRPGVRDLAFAEAAEAYLGHLQATGFITGWRLARRKLGLGPADLPEFHLVMDLPGLAALDRLFEAVSARVEPIEGLHHGLNRLVCDFKAALYRPFPDPHRQSGQELF